MQIQESQQNQEACSAEHRHSQLFSLSFSLYYFLKLCKTKCIRRGFTGKGRPEVFLALALSVLWLQSSCPKRVCTSSLAQCEILPEPRLDIASLSEVCRALLAGCYMQQKCSTLPQEAVMRTGLRVQFTQNLLYRDVNQISSQLTAQTLHSVLKNNTLLL